MVETSSAEVNTGVNAEILEGEEVRLSDNEMGRLISSFGNHEAKAFTFVLMFPGEIYNLGQLHRRFVELQGPHPGWITSRVSPYAYCEQSLSPIGLVVKDEIQGGTGEYGYRLTTDKDDIQVTGEQGQLLAALLLDFSSRYPDVSLIDLFGSTSSASKRKNEQTGEDETARAPVARWKIFQELATTNLVKMRQVDLSDATGVEPSTLKTHLRELHIKGIIQYDYVEAGKPVSYYLLNSERPDSQPETFRGMPTLTQRVYDIMISHPEHQMTIDDVIKVYLNQYDPEGKLSHKGFKPNVANVLSHLQRLSYVQRGEFGEKRKSSVTITQETRNMLLDLVTILDGFQDQDSELLGEAERLVHELRVIPSTTAALMAKAHEHSPHAKQRDTNITISRISEILVSNPEATTTEIRQRLSDDYGFDFGITRIRSLRRKMRSSE